MCEILFSARDDTNDDPTRDRVAMWKRGYAIMVEDDGYAWTRLTSKQVWIAQGNQAADWPSQGKTVLVKIPGVPAEKARTLLDPQTEDDAGVDDFDGTKPRLKYRLRRWSLRVADIPLGIRQTLNQDGEVTVTLAQVRNFIKRIRDDAQYTDID